MTNPAYVLGTQLGNPELKWETQDVPMLALMCLYSIAK